MHRSFGPLIGRDPGHTSLFHVQKQKPVLYLKYRGCVSGMTDPSEQGWWDDMEKRALDTASFVVALSSKEQDSLCRLIGDNNDAPMKVSLLPSRGDYLGSAVEKPVLKN